MLYLSVILFELLVVVVVACYLRRTGVSRLPPGPPGLPPLGNIFQLPSQFLWYKLDEWTKEYGPLYTFWISGQPFVVLGSVKVAADVLDRASGVTSDRPAMIKAREFFCRDNLLQFQDRTALWRAKRRSVHANLNVRSAARFTIAQAQDAANLVLGLLEHPHKLFHEPLHRFAPSVIFRSIYGGQMIPNCGPDPCEHIEHLHV
ncbi:cytochrome P450 [Calocera cornea HHB12733]|uniref:Cytochrome P450 n=1 Tax=Calocera cornea HHB12733 TaxID=1353952 RepID=A0A165GTM5_9BASI|nr:cytochrome P450 [Calocera cornea HHB12733]